MSSFRASAVSGGRRQDGDQDVGGAQDFGGEVVVSHYGEAVTLTLGAGDAGNVRSQSGQ